MHVYMYTCIIHPSLKDKEVRGHQALAGHRCLSAIMQIDSESPLVREWGLWAIRNLCEGNMDIQQHIEALQLQGAAPHPDLDRLGFQVEMDRNAPVLRPSRG